MIKLLTLFLFCTSILLTIIVYQNNNKPTEVISQKFTDTLIVFDTVFISQKNNAKIVVKQDTTTRRAVDSLIKLQKDSLYNILQFVLPVVDTTFQLIPSGSLRVNYQPLYRELWTEVEYPKIIQKITIHDSVVVNTNERDLKEYAIITIGSVLFGVIVGLLN